MTDTNPLWHGMAHMPSVKDDRRVIARGECAWLSDSAGHLVLDRPAKDAGHGPLQEVGPRGRHADWRPLESLLARGGADRAAGFFGEPVMGTGGVIQPAPGYLENVQRLWHEDGVLLVVHELICRF